MPASETILLDGSPLSVPQVQAVASRGARVAIGETARQRLQSAHAAVQAVAAGEQAVYGINTGFGSLAHVRVAPGAPGSRTPC